MMKIVYRDKLGYVIEEVDEYGVSFSDGTAYFNDKKIPIDDVKTVTEE